MKDKPNEWITVADLMAGVVAVVMLLFVIAALHIARKGDVEEAAKAKRAIDIAQWLQGLDAALQATPTVALREGVVDLGSNGRFARNSSQLTSENADGIRQAVRSAIPQSQNELGRKWLKQFVIIGYADESGDYLYNLNLSLERSQRTLCELLAPSAGAHVKLDEGEREAIRDLFLVSGYSFNGLKNTKDESRRVEIRVEFRQLDEPLRVSRTTGHMEVGHCKI